MKLSLLTPVLVAGLAWTGVAEARVERDPDPDCMRTGGPVPFSAIFADSAAAASLIEPLLSFHDSVSILVTWHNGGRIAHADSSLVADSAGRAQFNLALARRMARSTPAADPRLSYFALARRDPDGDASFSARSVVVCRPQLNNLAGMRMALARYQSELRASGHVVLWMFVDSSGAPTRVEVHRSSGNAEIDAAAVEAGRMARFDAAYRDGEPVAVWVELPITFEAP